MPGTVGFEWWIVADRFGWEGVGNANLRGCSVALDRQRSPDSGGRRGIVIGVAGRRRDDDPTQGDSPLQGIRAGVTGAGHPGSESGTCFRTNR